LVFLGVFVKERVIRVKRGRVIRLREGWFISAKGVPYGHLEDR
jgi:hypothetical protein